MKATIINIKISGFRNITDARIDMGDITAIIGLNGYGKSNLITAIDFGIEFIKAFPNDKKRLMGYLAGIPLLKSHPGMNYSFEIEVAFTAKDGACYTARYGYSFRWQTDRQSSEIVEEHLDIKSGRIYKAIIKRTGTIAKYCSSQSGRCTKPILIDSNALVLNKLSYYDNTLYIDIIRELNTLGFYVENHLDARSCYEPDPIIFNSDDTLDAIRSIPRTIWKLKQEHENEYNILIDAFQQLFPNITNIDCEEHGCEVQSNLQPDNDSVIQFSDKIYIMKFTDSTLTQALDFKWLSDGTKRVFQTLTFALLANLRQLPVLVLEEPENSIHPSLLQSYLRILAILSGDCKILLTSHSPYMVQYMPIDSIYIGLHCNYGSVDFRRILKPQAIEKIARENEQSVGDLLFEYMSYTDFNEFLEEYLSVPCNTQASKNENEDDERQETFNLAVAKNDEE